MPALRQCPGPYGLTRNGHVQANPNQKPFKNLSHSPTTKRTSSTRMNACQADLPQRLSLRHMSTNPVNQLAVRQVAAAEQKVPQTITRCATAAETASVCGTTAKRSEASHMATSPGTAARHRQAHRGHADDFPASFPKTQWRGGCMRHGAAGTAGRAGGGGGRRPGTCCSSMSLWDESPHSTSQAIGPSTCRTHRSISDQQPGGPPAMYKNSAGASQQG